MTDEEKMEEIMRLITPERQAEIANEACMHAAAHLAAGMSPEDYADLVVKELEEGLNKP